MAFADILQSISEETDRATLDAMARKYPSLKKFAESGEALEGLRPRLKALGGDQADYENNLALPVKELEEWRAFKNGSWKDHLTEKDRLKAALETAQATITTLNERSETDMTPEEIKEVVRATLKEANVVTSPEMEARITKSLAPEGDVYKFVNGGLNGQAKRFEQVYSALTPKVVEHAKKFGGEILDPKAVFDHMTEMAKNRNVPIGSIDPLEAYNDYVAPRVAESDKAATAAAIADAEKRGEQKGRTEAMKTSGRAQPVDGSGNQGPQGALMRRWEAKREANKDQPLNRKLGSGAATRAGVDEYREKVAQGEAA